MTPQEHNDRMIEEQRKLQDLMARVFAGAHEGDKEAFLIAFADWSQAFNHQAIADPALRDIMQGRRQAFFWLADHLQLPLATCWPRYLKGT